MAKDVCDSCGLPDELCACEALSRNLTEVEIDIKPTRRGSDMTRLKNLGSYENIDELASTLKGEFGCGGGPAEGETEIHLQGVQLGRGLVDFLEEREFQVTVAAEV